MSGPCLQQFNGVFSKFVKQGNTKNVAHANSGQYQYSARSAITTLQVLSQETTINLLLEIKSAQLVEVVDVD